MVGGMSVFRYALISKSIRGASHVRSGKPNQDSYKIAQESGALILAAADGHGSDTCPHSKSGSVIAVNVFCKTMSDYCRQYAGDFDALRVLFSREGDTAIARSIDAEWKRRVTKAHSYKLKQIITPTAWGEDKESVWKLYGTTLLGVVITPPFVFAYQLGDGDIAYADEKEVKHIITGDKLLGTETYSLSKPDSWQKAITSVVSLPNSEIRHAFMLSTDGFSNSYRDEKVFLQTVADYYKAIVDHGVDAVNSNIKSWLNETSKGGSGDDITVLIAFNVGME